jgi:O-antigen/teichoic acid export membrane protein
MKSIAHRSALSAAWLAIRFGGRQTANAVAFFWLASLMEPGEFGIASVPVALVIILRTTLMRGVRDAVVQRLEVDQEFLSTSFWTNLGFSIGLFFTICVISPIFPRLFDDPRVGILTIVSAITLLAVGASAVQEAIIERNFQHKTLTIAQIVASIFAAGSSITLAIHGAGAWAVIAYSAIEAFGIMLVTWFLARWAPSATFSRNEAIEIIRFSWPISVSATITGGTLRIIQIIVAVALGPVAIAYFRVASQINQLVTQIISAPMAQILLPAFARSEGEKSGRYVPTLSVICAVSAPAFLGAGALSPYIVPRLVGVQWAEAGTIAAILSFGIFSTLSLQVLNPLLIAMGRSKRAAWLSIGSAATAIAAAAIGAHWGTMGAAAGFVLRGVLTIPVSLFVTKKSIGVPAVDQSIAIAAYGIPAILMYALVSVVLSHIDQITAVSWISLFSVSVLGATFYLIWVRVIVSRFMPTAYKPLKKVAPKMLEKFM